MGYKRRNISFLGLENLSFFILLFQTVFKVTVFAGNCTDHKSCSTCIGYIFPNEAGCVWCGFKAACFDQADAPEFCFAQEIEHQCSATYLSYLSFLLLSACFCFCFGSCCLRRLAAHTMRSLPNPIMRPFLGSRNRTGVLRSAIETGFGEGVWGCPVCEFENRPKTSHCDLCGTACPEVSHAYIPEGTKGAPKASMLLNSDLAALESGMREPLLARADRPGRGPNSHPHLAQKLSARQRQAKRRKMWTRKKNLAGEYHWERASNSTSKDPGQLSPPRDESMGFCTPSQTKHTGSHLLLGQTFPESPAFLSTFFMEESEEKEETILTVGWEPAEELAIQPAFYLRTEKVLKDGTAHEIKEEMIEEIVRVSSLKFLEKHLWFMDRLQEIQIPWSQGHLYLEVFRKNILEDSFNHFTAVRSDEIHMWMKIEFMEEDGVDAGGIEREWFLLLFQALFDPLFGMFIFREGAYSINPASGTANELHLEYFHFTGRLIGKALMEHQSLPIHLSLLLLKHILGQPISLSDMEFIDPQLYKNLKWLRKNENVQDLHLDFTITLDYFGKSDVFELKPGGQGCIVTDENKEEYLQMRLQHAALTSIQEQLAHLLRGLYEVVPYRFLSVFDYQELELLICGLREIDTEDWRTHTKYHGDYARLGGDHPVIVWFWEVIHSLSAVDKSRFLQFCTGSSRISAHGFRTLHSNDGSYREFNITSITKEECPFPRAHTCFNKLDLPLYASKAELQQYITMLLQADLTGFSID